VCGAQAWTDETNGTRGRKIRSVGGDFVLKGSAGEGGRRGGRRVEVERERERGGLGTAWSSTAAWRRRCSGPTAARCRATVEGGGVGATRDGVTDRWAGMRRGGPVVSG
jgi:hypothetical protein